MLNLTAKPTFLAPHHATASWDEGWVTERSPGRFRAAHFYVASKSGSEHRKRGFSRRGYCGKTRVHGSLKNRSVERDGWIYQRLQSRLGFGKRCNNWATVSRADKTCPSSGCEAALWSRLLFCICRDIGWARAIARGRRPETNGSLMGCDFSHFLPKPSELKTTFSCHIIILRNWGW